ncbi:hypothetical protein K493DRAFT_302691 [Basidiobolus meristosporus CBS 931.73]|uniref:Uncharacterized protein n=1 Tax=Basidiobolus meristosporus CBS 931.73 TaxID=1314790 RepID=A0A1Y1Y610_9FUNG|nr:hypothetical protein K493DRAFT_302691 [Basidiobolus meristosporus CBS 931.73]|eukprot:ORX93399.1 hypothetical protein K493DRAFT_302691 [Basidiobolus meristosporus CBS 931.73]
MNLKITLEYSARVEFIDKDKSQDTLTKVHSTYCSSDCASQDERSTEHSYIQLTSAVVEQSYTVSYGGNSCGEQVNSCNQEEKCTQQRIQLYRRVRCRSSSCSNHENDCYQKVQPTVETSNVQVPLFRQVFTTVIGKHENLNTASTNSDKRLDVRFQADPSLEVDDSAGVSEYAKQKRASNSEDGSSYPIVMVQPAQDEAYLTLVVGIQYVE